MTWMEIEPMHDEAATALVQRVHMTHGWILKITEELTDEQLSWRLIQTGPPAIGWHLWHISRWADRLQASFHSKPDQGIWETEDLAVKWGLDPSVLGLLETGVLMDRPAASLLPQVGKGALLDYARRTFGAADQALADLEVEQFHRRRESILAIKISGDSAIEAPGADTTVAGDLGFHMSHASRHLGMIEVIRGMQGLRGTATI